MTTHADRKEAALEKKKKRNKKVKKKAENTFLGSAHKFEREPTLSGINWNRCSNIFGDIIPEWLVFLYDLVVTFWIFPDPYVVAQALAVSLQTQIINCRIAHKYSIRYKNSEWANIFTLKSMDVNPRHK